MNEPGGARRFLKRSRAVAIAGRIAMQQSSRLRARFGRAAIGATHRGFDLRRSLNYVDTVFHDYLTYGGIERADLEGARVLEVGPGDNFGVALRLLAAGAEQVVAVDRYETRRDPVQQHTIYIALLERLSPNERERAEAAVRITADAVRFDPERLRIVEGVPIERAADRLGPSSFDFAVSRAVMEHVYDVDQSFRAIDGMLRPGAVMAHKIDLSDHGLFTTGGHHPLTFLTVSDRVYRCMGGEAGLPNRRRISDYRGVMAELGYRGQLQITHVISRPDEILPPVVQPDEEDTRRAEPMVAAIRPHLLPRFRRLSDADLAVTGIFMRASKPAG